MFNMYGSQWLTCNQQVSQRTHLADRHHRDWHLWNPRCRCGSRVSVCGSPWNVAYRRGYWHHSGCGLDYRLYWILSHPYSMPVDMDPQHYRLVCPGRMRGIKFAAPRSSSECWCVSLPLYRRHLRGQHGNVGNNCWRLYLLYAASRSQVETGCLLFGGPIHSFHLDDDFWCSHWQLYPGCSHVGRCVRAGQSGRGSG